MKGFGDQLIGDAERFTFEQRIFNFVILLSIGLTAFGTIMDLYYKASITIDLLFLGCWVLTYYLVRFRGLFDTVSVVSTGVLVFAFFPYIWISSGGSGSIIPLYSIAFIAIISIILKGRFRLAMVISLLAVELLLLGREVYLCGKIAFFETDTLNLIAFALQLTVIMAVMAALIIVYSNTYLKEKARSEAYGKTIEEQFHQQVYYMENLEQLNYRLKSERHDFNNHLGVIYGLLENGETDNAKGYCTRLVKTAQEYQNIVNIPYATLRAMLNYKLSAALESGVALKIDVDVPGRLSLNEFDIAVILGNLLDNAAEACAKVDEADRYITLTLQYKPDYLVLQIENPMPTAMAGDLRTSKPDAEKHGFGLHNIEFLVGKHNGLLKIEPGNGVFSVSIALLVESKKV